MRIIASRGIGSTTVLDEILVWDEWCFIWKVLFFRCRGRVLRYCRWVDLIMMWFGDHLVLLDLLVASANARPKPIW